MIRISILTILFFSLMIFFGCQGNSSSKTKSTPTAIQPVQPATQPAAPHPLPSITEAEMQNIFNKCDYIDFIFYNMDFSISVNDKNNVKQVVNFVDRAQPPANLTCPTMGRIIFQHNGEILIEADMHYSDECKHFIFFKDNKPTYANKISSQGITYFQQMFSRVKVAAPK